MIGLRHAGVVGWPIAHSRSPIIHRYWLAHHGLAGTYDRIAVPPEQLAALVARIRSGELVGCNVTIPHKERVAALCDRLTPGARRLGAVNTLWLERGEIWGDTTDGAGFLGALDAEAPQWDLRRDRAVVIGAGGAARAIVAALHERGFSQVHVANRTFARAADLVARLGGTAMVLEALPDVLAGADLLVNTTAAGMAGQPSLALDVSALPSHAVVDDIVYVPQRTPLLAAAADRGLRTVGGLGMLLHQAAPGFARWFGIEPTVTPGLRALVEADLARAVA